MPKYPKPFFRTARGAWFVQVAGKQINLGPDREAAFRRYHEVMGRPKADTQRVTADAVLGVLDAFLDWCQNHKAGRTYDWYRDYLESFARTIPQGMTTARLKPFHVQQWLDANPGWKTGKRGAVIAVQRAFNWAVRMGLIDTNPIRSLEKPKAGRREHVITPDQFGTILSLVKDAELYGNLETPGHLTNRHVVPPARPAISWTTIRPWKRTVAADPPSHPRAVLQLATRPDPAYRPAQVPFLPCSASG